MQTYYPINLKKNGMYSMKSDGQIKQFYKLLSGAALKLQSSLGTAHWSEPYTENIVQQFLRTYSHLLIHFLP